MVIKRITDIISFLLYSLVFLYILLVFPGLFGFKPLIVLSGSMKPAFDKGTLIFYEEVEENNIKEGDIVTFSQDDKLVTHRIFSKKGEYYETKGDANEIVDAKMITYEDIKGKVIKYKIPYLGYYVKFLTENKFVLPLIIFILLIKYVTDILYNKRKREGTN